MTLAQPMFGRIAKVIQSLSNSCGKGDGEVQSIGAAVGETASREGVGVDRDTRAGEGLPKGTRAIPSQEFGQVIIRTSELVWTDGLLIATKLLTVNRIEKRVWYAWAAHVLQRTNVRLTKLAIFIALR